MQGSPVSRGEIGTGTWALGVWVEKLGIWNKDFWVTFRCRLDELWLGSFGDQGLPDHGI